VIKCHGLGSVPGEGKGSADRLDVKVGKLIFITSHATYQYGLRLKKEQTFINVFLPLLTFT
jgi:hypothetical protein